MRKWINQRGSSKQQLPKIYRSATIQSKYEVGNLFNTIANTAEISAVCSARLSASRLSSLDIQPAHPSPRVS